MGLGDSFSRTVLLSLIQISAVIEESNHANRWTDVANQCREKPTEVMVRQLEQYTWPSAAVWTAVFAHALFSG